jgi:putative nucleotidyltransferase with HDIG domain
VTRRQGLILAAQSAVFGAAVITAGLSSNAADWQPVELVLLLLVLCVGSDMNTVELRRVRITGSFLSLVLAMALLGPAPAAAIGVASSLVYSLVSRQTFTETFGNVAVFAAFPVVGGLLMELSGTRSSSGQDGLDFAGVVLVVFMITNSLNFALVAAYKAASGGARFVDSVRAVYVTVLPAEFATALLTAGVAFSYARIGVGAVGLAAVVLFVFQYLLRAGVQAFERGEQLEGRTKQLASLQMGLLTTVVQTLSMRDAMTARHSAAVARYARETAKGLGLPEREQELIHTAALLHDIGKFIFPDSILFADRKLTDEEWATVKLHPEQGARLVRRIEGYGPVADIIYCHHERVDGNGYYKVAPENIPLGSRIIAVADTYDVMTSRDSYRRPVSSEAAIMELRRVAGAQLDPMVVEAFIEIVEAGRIAFHHADETDFERELNFDRWVDDYAKPRVPVLDDRSIQPAGLSAETG